MLDYSTLRSTLADLGEPEYRARQAYHAVARNLVSSFDQITALPASLREALAARLDVSELSELATSLSRDGETVKTLFAARDGALVEAVAIRSGRRTTVCVSSQVGCAVGCAFCASGRGGLSRDLSAAEIADQVVHFERVARREGRRVTNVVVMGMGEPFHNYDATLAACRLVNDGDGLAVGARSIAVSTAGVVPGILRFAAEPEQFNLAVSLHAATDEVRDRLVPLNRTYPLAAVLDACRRYVDRTGRKLMFEYVLLPGANDGPEQVDALVRLLRGPLYHVNVIALNETDGRFPVPSRAAVREFAGRLRSAGLACTVRRSPGADIAAACGQLAAEHGSA